MIPQTQLIPELTVFLKDIVRPAFNEADWPHWLVDNKGQRATKSTSLADLFIVKPAARPKGKTGL